MMVKAEINQMNYKRPYHIVMDRAISFIHSINDAILVVWIIVVYLQQ